MKKIDIANELLKNSKKYGAEYEKFIQDYIANFNTIKKQKKGQEQEEVGNLQSFDACLSYLESELVKSKNNTFIIGYGLFKIDDEMFCIANDKKKVALILGIFKEKVHISCYPVAGPWEQSQKDNT